MKAVRIGKPFNTGAVVDKPSHFLDKLELNGFDITKLEDSIIMQYRLAEDDIVLGLGEMIGGINRRGRKYITWCYDTPVHTPEVLSLYGAHPFIMVKGRKDIGLFIDFAGEIEFDVGFTDSSILKITISSQDFELYCWDDLSWQKIVSSYIELTGGIYVPPRWAFGFQQSRWSYPDADTIKEVAHKFRKLGIPCDAIYMDIDYMDDYKVFSVSEERFPEFGKFAKSMQEQGFHLVPIIDPGIKADKDYEIYKEGIENKYFCTDEMGKPFEAAVWPGLTHFPDYLNPDVRAWWGRLYDRFIELGIDGFWNDMNEPAIFYTDYQQKEIIEEIKEHANKDKLEDLNIIYMAHRISNFHNNREDYKRIYHHPETEVEINHEKVHNLYGAKMALSFADHVKENYPDKRFLIFSRSSYSGSQRYSGIWYGDNKSWWQHLEMNIKMLVNCNLMGYLYSGADIGGFGDNCQSELMLRWLQLGVFSPLMRNHAAKGTRNQELWEFEEETLSLARNTIRLRYSLLPWLYSQFLEYAAMNIPLIRPLLWDFDEKQSRYTEDQFIYGEGLMAAPIYKPNSRGRNVWLPEGKWLLWKMRSWEERELELIESGHHFLECSLDRQLVFIKENSLIALQEPEEFVGQRNPDTLIITGLVSKTAELKMLWDIGNEPAYSGISVLDLSITNTDGDFEITIDTVKRQQLPWKHLIFELYNANGNSMIIHKNL